MMAGKLYLIPCPLGIWDESTSTIPLQTLELIKRLNVFAVEEVRTARRYIKKVYTEAEIDNTTFYVLNKHTKFDELMEFLQPCLQGKDMGVLSESGCPGIADPGALLVETAHQLNIKVVPLVGPSSIIMALMASGFNGQSFAFNGYLPIEKVEKIKRIKALEQWANKSNQSQIFIETPFRNNHLLQDILLTCKDDTMLCIASEISTPEEFILSKPISFWKKNKPELNKRNTVFVIG
jgi:16S rRNA (cytidine1402-2'-O)-methyltransferase